jgi:chromate reductase, NAD(P)H dehydrogenase (quinone)
MGTGDPAPPGRVLLVSGSTRTGSTNTALLRTLEAAPPPGVEAVRYRGMTSLPHFNPDHDADPLPAAVVDLRAAIAAADAVLLCTPEYAGALPGTFKNLLDWTVGGIEMYRKPVAWVNVSGSATRAAGAHASLAAVLGYLHADVVEQACAHIPVARDRVGPDGLIADPGIRRWAAEVVAILLRHAATRPDPDPVEGP